MRADDARRAAEHCRDLGDSALIGAAMDEPVSASKLPVRTFGQLPNLHVPEDFDEPLTDSKTLSGKPIQQINSTSTHATVGFLRARNAL